jgi:hypothetical protein
VPVLSAVPLSTTLTAHRLARARATLVRTVSADDLPCLGVAVAEQLGEGVRGALTGFKHSRRHRLLRLPSGIACLTVVCLANCAMLRHALGHSLPGGSRRDHGYVPVKLQETIAVRRALIMKTPDAAVCRGAADPGRT